MPSKSYPGYPLPEADSYYIEGVSTNDSKAVHFNNLELKGGESSTDHGVYRISLVVMNTNRAAMSEYLLVMRPDPDPNNRTVRAFQYLQRTAVVLNQVQAEDINTPVLFFDASNKHLLKVKLAGMNQGQTVLVNIEKLIPILYGDSAHEHESAQEAENDYTFGRAK